MSGPFGSSPWGYNPGGDFYSHTIDQSLRFEDGDTAYLSHTPPSAGNRKTWTWSGWVKRGNLSIQRIFTAGTSGSSYFQFRFDTNHEILMSSEQPSLVLNLKTTQKFRDPSAWYHLVLVMDTTQSTAADRTKLYVNGSLVTDFSSTTRPSQNTDLLINSTTAHMIGALSYATSAGEYDGYMAEINFLDGIANDPTTLGLGEFKDGVWIPKKYSGSYGNEGFHLTFQGTGTATTSQGTTAQTNIGDDQSGNGNNWAVNNLVSSDVVPDSPTNNFATLNPLHTYWNPSYPPTISEGNLKTYTASPQWATTLGTIGVSSGKWYAEFLVTTGASPAAVAAIGILDIGAGNPMDTSSYFIGVETNSVSYYGSNGTKYANGSNSAYGNTWGLGDIIGVALDLDAGTVKFYKNNTVQNSGTAAASSLSGTFAIGCAVYPTGAIVANFGQDSSFAGTKTSGSASAADGNGVGDFFYSPPSGHLAVCSSNLPEPEIIDGTEYFNTLLWTGDGSNPRTLSGLDFAADFIWHKARSSASMDHHAIQDVVRGFNTNNNLYTSLTAAETTYQNRGVINSVSSTGFTFNQNASDYSTADGLNQNNSTFVAWNWLAGTAFSNSAGANGASIASSGQVNTKAGFSIVSYTGSGSNATVAHGLGVAPSMVIIKSRADTTGDGNWLVYAKAGTVDETDYLLLNGTGRAEDEAGAFNDTAATTTTFSLGTFVDLNQGSITYIAYCFANVEGYSKVGSYTGNGSTSSGSFVYTGFRPAWVMIKCSSSSSTNWLLLDNKREGYNSAQDVLFPESNADEETNAAKTVDFLSNGFIAAATTNASTNASGGNYIYLAFAENPFKFANAR